MRRSFLLLLLFSLSLIPAHVRPSASPFTYIYSGCSKETTQPNSPFQSQLNSFLSSVVASAADASYSSLSSGNPAGSPTDGAVFGLYQCRGDLSRDDCSACVKRAVSRIGLVCPDSYGARLQLDGCFVRYEHQDFAGKMDTDVGYKRCSSRDLSDGDSDSLKGREDVLAGLQSGGGFRKSGSGPVQGYGQCLGDLNPGDCSACLGEAVKKMKELCGSAATADVFLGNCYAKYWASGYADSDSDSDSSPGSHDDDVGKTVAIIVGVLAGVAVFIILLSFLRSSFSYR